MYDAERGPLGGNPSLLTPETPTVCCLYIVICTCQADWVPTRIKAVYLVLGFGTREKKKGRLHRQMLPSVYHVTVHSKKKTISSQDLIPDRRSQVGNKLPHNIPVISAAGGCFFPPIGRADRRNRLDKKSTFELSIPRANIS